MIHFYGQYSSKDSFLKLYFEKTMQMTKNHEQVAELATIAHLGASIMFGDTIIGDAQRQVVLNLKQ